MTRRKLIPLILATALVMPLAATATSSAFATEDPSDVQTTNQTSEPPPSVDEPPISFVAEESTIEELPAEVQDAIEAHTNATPSDQAREYSQQNLEDALTAIPADCQIELGAELTDALAACGVAVESQLVPVSPEPSEDPSTPTPDISKTSEPSQQPEEPVDPSLEPDPVEPSEPGTISGPAGGGMPVGGFSPVRVPAAVGNTCDGTVSYRSLSRTQICGHYNQIVIDFLKTNAGVFVVGGATIEFYMLATTDPASYRITLENKARVTSRFGTLATKMPTVNATTGLRDINTNRWVNSASTFTSRQITARSWYNYPLRTKSSPGMRSGTYRYYWPAFAYELTMPSRQVAINTKYTIYGTTIRCDNRAVNGMRYGCVSDFTPTLTYSKTGPEGDAAIHIEKAQALGSPSELHREYPVGNNRSQICPSGSRLPRAPGYDCDEYPFNSVVEGGTSLGNVRNAHPIIVPAGCRWAQVNPPATSVSTPTSRCQVLATPNRTAGQQLNAFYKANRIINGDAFNVVIVP